MTAPCRHDRCAGGRRDRRTAPPRAPAERAAGARPARAVHRMRGDRATHLPRLPPRARPRAVAPPRRHSGAAGVQRARLRGRRPERAPRVQERGPHGARASARRGAPGRARGGAARARHRTRVARADAVHHPLVPRSRLRPGARRPAPGVAAVGAAAPAAAPRGGSAGPRPRGAPRNVEGTHAPHARPAASACCSSTTSSPPVPTLPEAARAVRAAGGTVLGAITVASTSRRSEAE